MNFVLEEQTMQASFELKRSPDRIAIAGLAMLATLIVGGASGYAVKSLTTAAQVIAPAAAVSTVGVASPATDAGMAGRALRLEVQDQKSQAGAAAPAAKASHAARRTQQ
jgi:small-conductance mechanosensitive channel